MDCTGVLTKSQIPPIPGSGAQGRRRPVPDDGRPPCEGLEQRRLAARSGGAGRVEASAEAARGVPHRAVVLLRPHDGGRPQLPVGHVRGGACWTVMLVAGSTGGSRMDDGR